MRTAILSVITFLLATSASVSATPVYSAQSTDFVSLKKDGALYQRVFQVGVASQLFANVSFVATGHTNGQKSATRAVVQMYEDLQLVAAATRGCEAGEFCFSFDADQMFEEQQAADQKGAGSKIILGL